MMEKIMASFDFVSDNQFRASLENDYSEMLRCLENSAYKSVHVLSGSIIEALLIDYLISENITSSEKAVKLDFGEAIKIGRENDIISAKSFDLCSVIRSYRNLIHPGRLIRLNEKVNQDSAIVAKSLVNLIIDEIGNKKRENIGYTAEQIVSKIKNDPGARSIIKYLLTNASQTELERIMLTTLPKHYLELPDTPQKKFIIDVFEECFFQAFELSPVGIKEKVAGQLARAIKVESGNNLIAYGTLFIRTDYFEYMSDFDFKIVKKYLLAKLDESGDDELLVKFFGIGKYLDKKEISAFVDPLIRIYAYPENYQIARRVDDILTDTALAKEELFEPIVKHIDWWINVYSEHDLIISRLENLKRSLESYLKIDLSTSEDFDVFRFI